MDIFAPRQTILGASATSDTSTWTLSSTSAAAAHVAGALVQGRSCGYFDTSSTPSSCNASIPIVYNNY